MSELLTETLLLNIKATADMTGLFSEVELIGPTSGHRGGVRLTGAGHCHPDYVDVLLNRHDTGQMTTFHFTWSIHLGKYASTPTRPLRTKLIHRAVHRAVVLLEPTT